MRERELGHVQTRFDSCIIRSPVTFNKELLIAKVMISGRAVKINNIHDLIIVIATLKHIYA